jgi:hypothetical protein
MRRRAALRGVQGAVATAPTASSGAPARAIGAAALLSGPPDTLLPGAMPRPDHLLPRATAAGRATESATGPAISARPHAPRSARRRVSTPAALAFARRHWHRLVVLTIIGAALTMSALAVRPVVFSGASSSNAPGVTADGRATALLRTVLGGGYSLLAARHSYVDVSPSMLSARSHHVPVVAATTSARRGEVSMRVTGSATLTLATPVDAGRCAFARDVASVTQFAVVATKDCRAAAAPARGWRS